MILAVLINARWRWATHRQVWLLLSCSSLAQLRSWSELSVCQMTATLVSLSVGKRPSMQRRNSIEGKNTDTNSKRSWMRLSSLLNETEKVSNQALFMLKFRNYQIFRGETGWMCWCGTFNSTLIISYFDWTRLFRGVLDDQSTNINLNLKAQNSL